MHLLLFNSGDFSELAWPASCGETFWTQNETLVDFQPRRGDSSLPVMGFKQRRKRVEVECLALPAHPPLRASRCRPSADKWCSVCSKRHDRMLYRFASAGQTAARRRGRWLDWGIRNEGKRERWKRVCEWGQGMRQVEKIHLSSGIWIIFLPTLHPPSNSSMHNVFLRHLRRCLRKAAWECDAKKKRQERRKGERKCLADLNDSLNMSSRRNTRVHTHTHTNTAGHPLTEQIRVVFMAPLMVTMTIWHMVEIFLPGSCPPTHTHKHTPFVPRACIHPI